jgi:hypothetical protein
MAARPEREEAGEEKRAAEWEGEREGRRRLVVGWLPPRPWMRWGWLAAAPPIAWEATEIGWLVLP